MNISYIVPCYNCELTLGTAIDSILQGNLVEGDELICVDDGSSDGTRSVIEEYLSRHQSIRYQYHERNRGGGAARNSAVQMARHEWIFCLDSDNILAVNSVSNLKKVVGERKSGGAFFKKAILFQDNPQVSIGERFYTESKNPFEGYLSRWDIPGASGNYLFKKSLWEKVGGYPEFAGALDTTGFGLRVAALGERLASDEEGFYFHRSGHESYWQRFRKGNVSEAMFQLLEPYFDRLAAGEVDYLRANRESFYGKIVERPLRLKRSIWKRITQKLEAGSRSLLAKGYKPTATSY